jgi:hypothetical protein
MRKTLFAALAAAPLLWGATASASEAPAPRHDTYSKARCAAFYEHKRAALAKLGEDLAPTPAQRPAWDEFSGVVLSEVAAVRDTCQSLPLREGQRLDLESRERLETAHLNGASATGHAVVGLVRQLTPGQRAVFFRHGHGTHRARGGRACGHGRG